MTDKQPEALRLADELDCRGMNRPSWKDQFDAGYELRRLHKENEALRARLAQPEHEPINYEEWNYDPMTGKPLWGKQPEQEPVAWHEPGAYGNVTVYKKWANENGWIPLYTAPPQREWQGLTDEEIMDACSAVWASHPIEVGRVVEEKLKEKNNDS